jgi:hypothetical protein
MIGIDVTKELESYWEQAMKTNEQQPTLEIKSSTVRPKLPASTSKALRRVVVRQSLAHTNTYALFFYEARTRKLVASWETLNGSIVDLGKVLMNYIKDDSLPADALKVTTT